MRLFTLFRAPYEYIDDRHFLASYENLRPKTPYQNLPPSYENVYDVGDPKKYEALSAKQN